MIGSGAGFPDPGDRIVKCSGHLPVHRGRRLLWLPGVEGTSWSSCRSSRIRGRRWVRTTGPSLVRRVTCVAGRQLGRAVGHLARAAPQDSTRHRFECSGQPAPPQPRGRAPPGNGWQARCRGPRRSAVAQPAPHIGRRRRLACPPQRQAAPPPIRRPRWPAPKALQDILRFQRLREQLASPGTAPVTLARAAADCGYYDQEVAKEARSTLDKMMSLKCWPSVSSA
jgi:hypothetical protein